MTSESPDRRTVSSSLWLLGLVIGLAAMAWGVVSWRGWSTVAGSDSAQQDAAEPEKAKGDDAKQTDVDPRVERLVIQPGEAGAQRQLVKPGHWATSIQRMQAVYQDFVGELDTSVINRQGAPYPVDSTPMVLESKRPVALAKGQPKDIETTFLVPQVNRTMQVRSELAEQGFGRSQRSAQPMTRMPPYQYYFVVLAKEPSRYALLKTLDSVTVPWDGESEADDSEDAIHYRVVLHDADRTIPFSDNSLTWTSIAYMLWDDVDPRRLTPEQAQALVDWLHWGGQLIVNGPDSLDLLKGSFLEPFLPASSGGRRKIAAADLADLNWHWAIGSQASKKRLAPATPWSGVELVARPVGSDHESDSLGERTGSLVMEQNVGRGRIVVTAMQLAERELVNWEGGFESFFNSAILRRPRREYRPGYYDELTLAWADPHLATQRLDAQLTTGLRYLARDLGVDTNYHYEDVALGGGAPETIRELRPPAQSGGIGAWNDFSASANVARESLVEAAGVEVPDTSFVVIALTLYLVALVPLNWLVFSAIGRVEWAWVAAPLIAIAGTWAIVDRARLDIGFVRAQTEIGLLELQPDYDRGHLSRYTALYTSLSTTYDIEFDTLTALAAPFPTRGDSKNAGGESDLVCDYERYDAARLTNVFVPSNTTNMVHSEQMFALDGAIRLGRSQSQNRLQIENRSQFTLRSVAVVERSSRAEEDGATKPSALRGVWIGELLAGESRPLAALPSIITADDKAPFHERRAAEERLQDVPRLNLEPMFRLALDVNNMEPGERRLVARIDDVLPGETISPAASQARGSVLVVAHLAYGPRPEPLPDLNTRRDVVKSDSPPELGRILQ